MIQLIWTKVVMEEVRNVFGEKLGDDRLDMVCDTEQERCPWPEQLGD